MTFEECAREFIVSHESGWRGAKTAKLWRAALAAHVYPVLGSLPVGAVDTEIVLRSLQPIWTKMPTMAGRVRAMIEAVLNSAKALGLRDGQNPAQWRGHLDHLLPPRRKIRRVRHHPALPFAEIPTFMAELRARETLAARALEFLILTTSRSLEARGARWDEIDLKQQLWVIPAERMKGGREHRVPRPPRAIAILREMAEMRRSEFAFPGDRSEHRPISESGLRRLLREFYPDGSATIHGFRSTFRDWAAETTGFANFVVEMALAHAVADGTEAAYRRGVLFEKRRKLMDAWAAFCNRQSRMADVVPIKRQSV
jgi:integrase